MTTSFDHKHIKSTALTLGENTTNGEARYIHGTKGKGMFTFYLCTIQRVIQKQNLTYIQLHQDIV